MKITVIGANSYIARNLIFFLKQKPEVALSLYDAQDESVDGEANYQKIDVLDPESLHALSLDVDVVYLFVGKTGSADGFDNPAVFLDINELALLNVLNEYRRQESTAKLVFPSTRLVYSGKSGPQKEDAEKTAKTIYAVNKLACERYLTIYHEVFDVRYCIARICIPYGTLIPNASSYGTAEFMLKKATSGEDISLYGDGSVRRTLTYMGDLVELLFAIGAKPEFENDIYNIGGEDFSLKEMALLIAARYDVNIVYTPYPEIAEKIESGDTVFDDGKLQAAIGGYEYKKFCNWIANRDMM